MEKLDEHWDRALAVVAHPDDLEYGGSSAIAKWTSEGKWVGYVIASDGEAGIASLQAHAAYLSGLGRAFDPADFIRSSTASAGRPIGVTHGVAFEANQGM